MLPSIWARLNEVVRAVREEFLERFRARLSDVEGSAAEVRREVGALRQKTV